MKLKFAKCFAWSVLVFLTMVFHAGFGQTRKNDQIIKKDSSRIDSKILIVEDQLVQYKKASDPDGPTFHLLKSDIAQIIYGNGETQTFSTPISSFTDPRGSSVIFYPITPWTNKEFTNDLSIWRPEDLRGAYKFYNAKAQSRKIAAIVFGSVGAAVAIGGIAVLAKQNRDNARTYGYSSSYSSEGPMLIVGGLVTGILVGVLNGVASARYRRNAVIVEGELLKRKEPLASFRLRPALNPLAKNAGLSLLWQF